MYGITKTREYLFKRHTQNIMAYERCDYENEDVIHAFGIVLLQ